MQIYVIIFSEKYAGMTDYNKIFKNKDDAKEYLKTVFGFTRVTDTLYRNEYGDELEISEDELIE